MKEIWKNIKKEVKNKMKALSGIELKIYPNDEQKNYFKQVFGCNRKVWNTMLEMLNKRHENNKDSKMLSEYDLNYLLKQLKNELSYLKYVDSHSLIITNACLIQAFKNFFNKKMSTKYPRFKSKHNNLQTYTTDQSIRVIDKHHIRLSKVGILKVHGSIPSVNTKIKRATVSKLPSGHYHLSLIFECDKQAFKKTNKEIGIDMGMRDLAILSNGKKYKSHYFSRYYEHKLLIWQRRLAKRRILAKQWAAEYNKQYKDNKVEWRQYSSYEKARIMCAKIQFKIKNKRKDYIHKVTNEIVKNYDVIAIEGLKVSNLLKNHKNARKLSNQGWSMFRIMLTYKAEWYGKQLLITNPAYTSQICSNCGKKNNRLNLDRNEWRGIEEWTCQYCGKNHDRDINAAINILNKAKLELQAEKTA